MPTLTMPTREFVGLLTDVLPFASDDPDDSTWHRIVLRYDGTRLHSMAGNGRRLAWTSWGRDDADDNGQLPMPDWPGNYTLGDGSWEMAYLPEQVKEIADKFSVGVKEGELPLRLTVLDGDLTVERDTDPGRVALRSTIEARPWDNNAPRIDEFIGKIAEKAAGSTPRGVVAYDGFSLSDFCNPKKVRQRGALVLTFGPQSTYIRVGRWFRGAIMQAEIPKSL